MKKTKSFLFSIVITLSAFCAIFYSSCQKDPTCSYVCLNGGSCTNGICRCPSGYYGLQCQYSKIIYSNNSYTTVRLKVSTKHAADSTKTIFTNTHDTTMYIKPITTVEYYGLPGDSAIATAYTFGPNGPSATSKDSIFGLTINWNKISTAFAKNGTMTVNLDVSTDYFFLQLTNNYLNFPKTWVPSLNDSIIPRRPIVNLIINNDYAGPNDTVKQPGHQLLFYQGNFKIMNDSFAYNVGYFGAAFASSVIATDDSGYTVQKYLYLNFSSNLKSPVQIP